MNTVKSKRKPVGCALFFTLLVLWSELPYLYTPPALTDRKLTAYLNVIKFIATHRSLGDIEISYFGVVNIHGMFLPLDYQGTQQYLSHSEIEQLRQLCLQLKSVHCNNARSDGAMVLFQPDYNYVIPHPPGVLYTLDSKDPNRSSYPLVAAKRPFDQIGGNWYMSRKLVPGGTGVYQRYIPKSVMDFSLKKPHNL